MSAQPTAKSRPTQGQKVEKFRSLKSFLKNPDFDLSADFLQFCLSTLPTFFDYLNGYLMIIQTFTDFVAFLIQKFTPLSRTIPLATNGLPNPSASGSPSSELRILPFVRCSMCSVETNEGVMLSEAKHPASSAIPKKYVKIDKFHLTLAYPEKKHPSATSNFIIFASTTTYTTIRRAFRLRIHLHCPLCRRSGMLI